ncbi:N-acyl homoserine lactonase family protein [Micromonospora sp. NPDC005206]|uniref:N-acyl homoserine lactonase family protein n=1 Tax=Micromonospora sp. NPDC005206 TaxID=3157022 RepID=UPI0033A6FCA8
MGWTIQALHVGTLVDFPRAALTYHRGFGEVHDVAMIMFLITGGPHPVIVDTGTGDEETTRRLHGYTLERTPAQHPLAALEAAGVDPADVGTVINTHLHWDHSSNNHVFPNARIVVQKAELAYAVDPLEPNLAAFERQPGVTPAWVEALGRTTTVEGDVEILPGISVVHLPGHTPGSQGVLVDGASGQRHLLAGDCVDLHANWQGDAKLSRIPSGSFTDLAAYMESFRKIERLGVNVIPSHDVEVVKQGTFA